MSAQISTLCLKFLHAAVRNPFTIDLTLGSVADRLFVASPTVRCALGVALGRPAPAAAAPGPGAHGVRGRGTGGPAVSATRRLLGLAAPPVLPDAVAGLGAGAERGVGVIAAAAL